MIIITSGAPYIDIDAYACIVAYQEFLQLLGKQAAGVSTSALNESIPPSLRALPVNVLSQYQLRDDDQYIIMDASGAAEFDPIVRRDKVIELFDHHVGYEQEWREQLGDASHIEFIGAAATLIYEAWVSAGKQDEMSSASAQLLAAGILDNTLNFNADITTDRDKRAYVFLAKQAKLQPSWIATYFKECAKSVLVDLPLALKNDTKYFKRGGLDKELTMSQLVLWDAREVIAEYLHVFTTTLHTPDKVWLANVISIAEGKSYFISDNPEVHAWLGRLTGTTMSGLVARADRLWLRKEIIKAAQEEYGNG